MRRADGTPRPVVWVGLVTVLVLLFLGCYVLPHGRPIRWDLPAEYRGWVEVQYRDPACPPLLSDGLSIVVRVPPDGRVCTSSSPTHAVRRPHRYEYVYADGARTEVYRTDRGQGGMIWGKFTSLQDAREVYFVGTEDEYRRDGGTPPIFRR